MCQDYIINIMDRFYFKNKNGVITLHSKVLDEAGFEKHCFTTRLGGVSEGHLAATNLSFSRECHGNVTENYRRVTDAAGIDMSAMALTCQEHTDIVRKIGSEYKNCGFYISDTAVDGYVTAERGIALVVFVADCVPVLIADPKKQVVAAVHSGWRGTKAKITQNAVKMMVREYGSDPQDIVAAIGPCIGGCCYEVGRDVYDGFGVPEYFTPKADGKFMLDLVKANTAVLNEIGVQRVESANECTMCKHELYYSHRYTKGKRGNMAAMIQI